MSCGDAVSLIETLKDIVATAADDDVAESRLEDLGFKKSMQGVHIAARVDALCLQHVHPRMSVAAQIDCIKPQRYAQHTNQADRVIRGGDWRTNGLAERRYLAMGDKEIRARADWLLRNFSQSTAQVYALTPSNNSD